MNEEEKNVFENETGKKAEPKAPFGKRAASSLYDFVEMIGTITVVIILCFSFVVRLNVVDGPSMENTLHTGEYLVVSDLFYKPAQGDIVVLQSPEAAEQYRKPLVKRVIATEGQTLDIDTETGKVTVDGIELEETYVNLPGAPSKMYGDHMTVSGDHAVITVTEGHVFVMGDNRNNSADSRLDGIGLIDERCIVGKVLLRIFPFNKITAFSNPFDGK
ncbi:MAG: signal peptidase I [Clostridia bacterium]|nr:signal peptidase I [Clostridia bacterium]